MQKSALKRLVGSVQGSPTKTILCSPRNPAVHICTDHLQGGKVVGYLAGGLFPNNNRRQRSANRNRQLPILPRNGACGTNRPPLPSNYISSACSSTPNRKRLLAPAKFKVVRLPSQFSRTLSEAAAKNIANSPGRDASHARYPSAL